MSGAAQRGWPRNHAREVDVAPPAPDMRKARTIRSGPSRRALRERQYVCMFAVNAPERSASTMRMM